LFSNLALATTILAMIVSAFRFSLALIHRSLASFTNNAFSDFLAPSSITSSITTGAFGASAPHNSITLVLIDNISIICLSSVSNTHLASNLINPVPIQTA
jgi:hypothetical protein